MSSTSARTTKSVGQRERELPGYEVLAVARAVASAFTVLGVPIWDTNTITKTLNFPEGAHTARLLFCGLGSNLQDGSWRQYFPADAYLDANGNQMIAPQDEVLFASLVTGILTIGLTVFALFIDLDISTTWAALRKDISNLTLERYLSLKTPFRLVWPAAEGLALGVAAGGETYESIKNNGGSTENIWSILLQLGSVIPKDHLQPWGQGLLVRRGLRNPIGCGSTRRRRGDSLNGEVVAVIEVVGDVATLAEVCAESIVAPWVIENEVQLTYPATITVNRDPRMRPSRRRRRRISWSRRSMGRSCSIRSRVR